MKNNIYLDANVIYGYFLDKYKELKGKETGEPKLIEFLLENKDKFEYYVSTITKIEIIRKLRTELNFEEQEALELWFSFRKDLKVEEFEENEIDWKFINEFRNWEDLNKQKTNNDYESGEGLQDSNKSIGRKESKGFSSTENNFTQRIREEGNRNNEEGHRERRRVIETPVTSFLILLLLTGVVFATHNPSVSHSANAVTNGTFSNNYPELEVIL